MCRSGALHKQDARYDDVGVALSSETTAEGAPRNAFMSFVVAFALTAALGATMLEFSLWFPFHIPGVIAAARKTYVPARYRYDDALTTFDNSPWTYRTDYLLTAVMTVLATRCWRARAPDGDPRRHRLRHNTTALLLCYGISTLAGGLAHQHFTTAAALNGPRFRALWCVCVANVAFASAYMGLIGREVWRVFGATEAALLGPWWFWPAYGSYMAAACVLGRLSFQRPACDIFIAGTSQVPSTLYCVAALARRTRPVAGAGTGREGSSTEVVRLPYRILFYAGFVGNFPLLPLYPLLVQYSGMTMAGINTLLHSWLLVTWSMQGISLRHLCVA